MKLSTRTRYGTRLMLYLALHSGNGPVLLREIAQGEEISEKYLSQIIIPLRSAGLVHSVRGVKGGYSLARPPDQITLEEVVSVLEGGLSIVNCVADDTLCSRVSRCVTRDIWGEVEEGIRKTLSGSSLADLMRRAREKKLPALMYTI